MEKSILNNISKLLKSAKLVYQTSDYTSATILYFKVLFAVLDLIILKKKGKTPKDHGERFRVLESDFSSEYGVLDKLYPTYRSTYSLVIDKLECDEVKKNVERIIEKYKIHV